MSENVLYYPYIKVPKNHWFTRVLLYWDSVGSIVPYEYTRNPEQLGSHMQSLLTEGLVKQIIPGQYIYKVPRFVDAFIEAATHHKQKFRITKRSFAKLPKSRIHMEKLDHIGRQLCEMGLAKEADHPWYAVESRVANQFMAYLAGVLSTLPEIKSRPITDTSTQLSIYESSNQYRSLILENLLPSPGEGAIATDLARFKSRNQNYLRKFRNDVESFLLQVASVADRQLRDEMVNRFLAKSKDDIAAIVDAMNSQGWTKISFGRFMSYAVAGTTLADAIATGGLLTTIAAAFGIGASVYTTYQESKLPEGLRSSYLAYAALAKRL